MAPPAAAQGPAPGECTLGTAEASLDINNIFATLFNTGSLFYGNSVSAAYLAPKASEHSPIYASGIWVGGQVNGDLRVAGSRYDGFTFWPGPLGSDGRPVDPNNCAPYDRLYSVTRTDIANFEAGLGTSSDLADWPVDLGAPVIDGDGVPGNYNLAGGDRPEIIGDQGIWWVMNDVGGEHTDQGTDPLGIEVQVLAFAFSRSDALGETTFYRYRIINKSGVPIEQTYISVFSDPDLGGAGDDVVGYDDELGLGFVYNADNSDSAYGIPPAAGYDFFQGPIIDGDTLGATAFSYFTNTSGPSSDPGTGEEIYNYMQGLWGDGTPMRARGDGYGAQDGAPITKFAFPGDPVVGEFWSELNLDGAGAASTGADRRFAISTGPFTLQPNDPQDIVFGVVFAQGASNLGSVTALRAADRLAQTAYDNNFQLAPPPPAPPLCVPGNALLAPGSGNCLEARVQDSQALLVWGYPSNSSNYLGAFEVTDVLLDPDAVDDNTYNFEGFNIYRYSTSGFSETSRELVATYDIANGVTRVVDDLFSTALGDLAPTVVARGTDSGLQYSLQLSSLTNYTDYYYGVSAYAYNEESVPKVIESAPTQITIRPSAMPGTSPGLVGDSLAVSVNTQVGQGLISAQIVDPSAVTGADYRVEFYETEDGRTNYNITNLTTGQRVLDGEAYLAQTGNVLPQRENVVVAEGISFNVVGPPGELQFIGQYSDDGTISRPLIGIGGSAYAASSPSLPPRYFVSANGATEPSSLADYTDTILSRTDWQGGASSRAPIDYEIRFVEDPETNGQLVWNRNWDEVDVADAFMQGWVTADSADVYADSTVTFYGAQTVGNGRLPFQVWEIYPDGSEVQVQAAILNDEATCGNEEYALYYSPSCLSSNGGAVSPALGSPAVYERIYVRERPYNEAAMLADPVDEFENGFFGTPSTIGRVLIAPFAGGAYALPAPGQAIRFTTSKPNLPGDSFTITAEGLGFQAATPEQLQAALETIQVVPNPYLGASDYETGNTSRVVRFTNLPEAAATVRIYTVSGTLVQTLRKEGASRSLDWNLETSNNLPVASGMYLIHIDVEGLGERVLKFGVVQRRTRISEF